ncbi:MAG TPA: hypothetical protein VI341_13865 [Actinomycetota bacterium]
MLGRDRVSEDVALVADIMDIPLRLVAEVEPTEDDPTVEVEQVEEPE